MQRGGNLLANPVARIVEPALPFGIANIEPARTDQHQHHDAGLERAVQRLDEIDTEFDAFDIAKDIGIAEMIGQIVGQAAGGLAGVVAPVTDEDAACHR